MNHAGDFNTLAQNGTGYLDRGAFPLQGKGSDLSNIKSIKDKAKRKVITQKITLGLVDASLKSGHSKIRQGYWNSYHCQSHLYTLNGRAHGKYCKNRCCTLCCANRKADIINRYLPVVETWAQPHFVTLTVKSVPFYRLNLVMKSMIEEFRAIVETYRKRNQRANGIKLVGVRSLESNFNPTKKWYNPHFHCLVANKEMAEILVKEWLKRSNKKWTNCKSQNISSVSNNISALIEVVKYGSKIFTEPDLSKRQRGNEKIYVAALHNIFQAMKGLRIFERFGFDLPKQEKKESITSSTIESFYYWIFHPEAFDWLNTETGNPLTNYRPSPELAKLLNSSVVSDLE